MDLTADINETGDVFWTALLAACAKRNTVLASLLVNSAADINVSAGYYGSVLNAGTAQNLELLSYLLENGASWDRKGYMGRGAVYWRPSGFIQPLRNTFLTEVQVRTMACSFNGGSPLNQHAGIQEFSCCCL